MSLCPGYYAQDGSKMVLEGPKERAFKGNIKRETYIKRELTRVLIRELTRDTWV